MSDRCESARLDTLTCLLRRHCRNLLIFTWRNGCPRRQSMFTSMRRARSRQGPPAPPYPTRWPVSSASDRAVWVYEVLKNALANGGEGQLGREDGGAVFTVKDRIDLDEIEAAEAPAFGDQLHGEMGLAIGDAPVNGSTHAGCFRRVYHTHIEAYVE